MPDKTIAQYEADYALKSAREVVEATRRHFERMAADLLAYEARLADITDPKKAIQPLSSVLHHVSCNNNPRLDLIGHAMEKCAAACEMLKTEEKYAGWTKIEAGEETA